MPRRFHVRFDKPLPTPPTYTPSYSNTSVDSISGQYSPTINSSFFGSMPPSPTEPRFSNRWNNPTSPRINLEGSWLDLESDDEDEHFNSARRRRKRSTSPTRDALSSLKDKLLSRRSSMYFRRQ
ncbi:hypothetical protein GGI22_005033 [Coemansia erecta]|nr:hypothetical protein GGI22_005033 [Coemansia erecta]